MSQQPPLQSPPAPTVRDEIAVTRLDGPAPTVRDGALSPRTLMQLPSALAGRYRIVQPLPAGGEADLLLVEAADGQRCVAKIYRYGIQVKTEVLDRLKRAELESVARLLEYEQSDGYDYEVLEYLPEGSLRSRLAAGPLAEEQARALVVELSAALALLHEHDILHRDLKPENVLIRQWQPLRIALTDFGIASVAEATQHFTTVARTLRYAAPEAATGVIGRAADYWSLGMLVLEALSGRHPFAGLSDAVLSYQLVTQPVDCGGVAEPWRMLCRGLLLRNPKQRWGRAEVERWLAGDASLQLPSEADQTVAATPRTSWWGAYRFGGVKCRTAQELAVQMAKNWEAAGKDFARGFISDWLRNKLHDQDLARAALDLMDAKEMGADERLLRLLVYMAPDLPPLYREYSLALPDLEGLAMRAVEEDSHAIDLLEEIYEKRLLAIFAKIRHIQNAWIQAVQNYESGWQTLISNGAPARLRPDFRLVLPGLLLVVLSEPFCQRLRQEVIEMSEAGALDCPWFIALGWPDEAIDAHLLILRLLISEAEKVSPVPIILEVTKPSIVTINYAAFTPGGEYVFLANSDGMLVLWDMWKGQRSSVAQRYSPAFTAVAVSPNGHSLFAGDFTGNINIWEVNQQEAQEFFLLKGHTADKVTTLITSRCGKYLLSASKNGVAKLWEIQSRERLQVFEDSGSVTAANFSPDGQRLLIGNEESIMRLWNVRTGCEQLNFQGHSDAITCIAFDPFRRHILSGSRDKTVKLWSIITGRILRTFQGHSAGVSTIAFSPANSRIFLSGSEDGLVKLWELDTGRELQTWDSHNGAIILADFSSSGNFILSVGKEGTINLWGIENRKHIAHFFNLIESNWLVMTCQNYYNVSKEGEKFMKARVGNLLVDTRRYRNRFFKPEQVETLRGCLEKIIHGIIIHKYDQNQLWRIICTIAICLIKNGQLSSTILNPKIHEEMLISTLKNLL